MPVENAAARAVISIPEKFDGTSDFDLWLRHFNLCANANFWDEAMKLGMLPTFLKDRAFLAFVELPATSTTFDDICDNLSKHFSPPERKRLFMAEFNGRVQQVQESAEDYARELNRLLTKAMPHLQTETREAFVLEQFLIGLRSQVQENVIQANPTSLAAAVSIASRCEAYRELRGKMTAPSIRSLSPGRTAVNEESAHLSGLLESLTRQVQELTMQVQALAAEKSTFHRNASPDPGRRNPSQGYGRHPSPSPTAGRSRDVSFGYRLQGGRRDVSDDYRSNSPRPPTPGRMRFLTCFQCGQPGHIRANCQQLPLN